MLKLEKEPIPTKITRENVEILLTGDSDEELIKDIDFVVERLLMIKDLVLAEK